MEKWYEIRKGGDFAAIGKKYGIDPLTARVMRNRGITDDEEARKYLYGTLDDLDDPYLLTGIGETADILERKIREGKAIRVIGDYDIDGVCATYILMTGLAEFGANVSYDIPERLTDGYGLNIRLVRKAIDDGVDTIVTVDNGISASGQVQTAKDAGLTVLVTDHHEPPYEERNGERIYRIPPADAVVDPNLNGCPYPNKALCGAGVAWKLIYVMESRRLSAAGTFAAGPGQASAACLRRSQTSPACTRNDQISPSRFRTDQAVPAGTDRHSLTPAEQCPLTMRLLPFAAFATVGDVMDLKGENRILVRRGLDMLPSVPNAGMQALIDACGMRGKKLTAYSIGFVLGPCINAGGRLETAHEAEELFLTDSPVRAHELAQRLSGLNEERRTLTDAGVKAAMAQLEQEEIGRSRVLVLYLPGTHESIVGIIAGKIRERTGKPSFVLTDAQEAGMLKGSGRSIEEYSMFDELVKCGDLLEKYGGHPMAAGLSLKKNNLNAFRKRINEACSLTDDDLAQKILLDAEVPLGYVSEKLAADLQLLQPFGKGNRRPLFGIRNLSLDSLRVLGARGNAVKMSVSSGNCHGTALYFGDAQAFLSRLREKWGDSEVQRLMAGLGNRITVTAAFYPDISEYRGNRELQIHITNVR